MEEKLDKTRFKTALVKGLSRCRVSLLEYRKEAEMFLVEGPFATRQWMTESELEDFRK